MSNSVLSLKNTSIFYQKNIILDSVNLDVKRGEFVYLIGKTGSGKSSLLKTLYGDLKLNNGEGEIVGYDLNNGKKIWKDKLPYVSYGNLSINKHEGKIYLIVNSTGGSKMPRAEKGDAIVAYILN